MHTTDGCGWQECHRPPFAKIAMTTNDMHGNGNIEANSLAQVEIECADCHGIGTHYLGSCLSDMAMNFGRELIYQGALGWPILRLG